MVNILPYLSFSTIPVNRESIVFNPDINRGKWCVKSYCGHKHGCPNFNKSLTCPPHAPYLANELNTYKFFLLISATFDFHAYKEAMRQEWIQKNRSKGILSNPTDKQLGCNIYWQKQLKKFLRIHVNKHRKSTDLLLTCGSGFGNHFAMEAVGIDVFQTYRNLHIDFEEHPTTKIVMSVLLCKHNQKIVYQKKLSVN